MKQREIDEHASSGQRGLEGGPLDRDARACSSSRANVGPLTKISLATFVLRRSDEERPRASRTRDEGR